MRNVQKIMACKQKAEQEIFQFKGVTGVDVGHKYTKGKITDEISIRVHVAKKSDDVPIKDRIPDEIDGVKTDVLESNFELLIGIKELDAVAAMIQDDSRHYDVLQGGIEISPSRPISQREEGGHIIVSFGNGTLGAIAIDNFSNEPVMLSNYHVMTVNGAWYDGDTINQPAGGNLDNTVGTVIRAVRDELVDCAIAQIDSQARPYKNAIKDIGQVRGTGNASLDMAVRKRGRTSLLTHGFIDGLNGTFYVNTDVGPLLFEDQISIRPNKQRNDVFSGPGDSGSAIVDSNNRIVALLFAGTPEFTLANPIQSVMNALDIRFPDANPCDDPSGYPLLRRSYRGDAVKKLQAELNQAGYNLVVDGIFGRMTEAAVIDFQNINNMIVDGIVGRQTWTGLLSDNC